MSRNGRSDAGAARRPHEVIDLSGRTGIRLLPREPFVKMAYVWLGYLAPPLLYALQHRGQSGVMAWTAAGVAAFLPLYFWGYWIEGMAALVPIAGITAIGVLLTGINPYASVFFIYASAFAFRTGPPRRAVGVLAIVMIAATVDADARTGDLETTAWAAGLTAVIGGMVIYFNAAGRKLRAAQDRARHLAIVAERERIGRDLHDLLGHTLSVIAIKAELASKLALHDPDRSLQEIRDVERISREALAEVRQAVLAQRHTALADELRNARTALDAAGITLECDVDPIRLPPAFEQTLALAVREAMTNIIRHAGARACVIRLRAVQDRARLEIVDDGGGGEIKEGSGLLGMRARVAALGGRIDRTSDAGVHLIITLPLQASVPDRMETIA